MADGQAYGGVRPRAEDARLLKGEGRYTDDIAVDGALHAVFLRAPHAHARIGRIDTAAARAMAGVALVLTGADVAALGTIQPLVRRQDAAGNPMPVPTRPALVQDVVRFVGDPVALVLARTRAEAEDAVEAIEIDWEDAPSVTDIAAAVQSGAPKVWPDLAPGNIAYVWQAGDSTATEAALARAAHVTEITIPVTRTTACPMEPRAVIAAHDPATGRFHLTTGLQAPWQARDLLARDVFGIPADRISVDVPDVGGSFGMKGQTFPEFGVLLHAARLSGRAVRWCPTRSESLLTDDQGRDVVMKGRLGLDGEGRILAVAMEGITALGAYLSTRGTLTTADNVPGICGPYRVPVAHARMRGIYTHTPPISPYRGAGRPEASLLIERLIDVAARETGRDPVELRRLNLLTPAELPCRTALGFTYDSGDFPGALDELLRLADHGNLPTRKAASAARGLIRGAGLAVIIARAAAGQFEAARMTLSPDGALILSCGAVSHGQGHATVFPAVAATVLGVDPALIRYDSGRSDQFDKAVGTFGSRSAGIAGPAVKAAAEALVAALRPEAARALNTGVDDLVFGGGAFRAPDGAAVTLAALATQLPEPVSGEGRFTPEDGTFPNSAHLCEVEIDPETGTVSVDRYAIVEDVGNVLNPVIVKGQIHGGIAQGLAQAMAERIAFDPVTGQPLTGSLMDFALPRAADLPTFTVDSHPVPTARNPLGVKGAGEGGTIGALPAFQNAVADALAPFGLRDVPMPATSAAIWEAINGAPKTAEGGMT